jgi:hypothetical protein
LADQARHAVDRVIDSVGLDTERTVHRAKAALERMDKNAKSAAHTLRESLPKR